MTDALVHAGPDSAPGGAAAAPRWRASTRQLVGFLIAAAVVPLVVLLALQITQQAYLEVEQNHTWLNERTELLFHRVSDALVQVERQARMVAERPQVRALDPDRCEPALAEIMRLAPHVQNVGIVDLDGNSVCSLLGSQGRPRPNIGQPPWLMRLKDTGGFVVGSAQKGIYTGRWILVAAYPVRNAGGAISGAAQIVLDLARFGAFVGDSVPPGASAGVIDGDGTLIAASGDVEGTLGDSLRATPLGRVALAEAFGAHEVVDADGESRHYGIRRVPRLGWTVFVSMTHTRFSATARATVLRDTLTALSILALIGVMVLRIQKRIAAPLGDLRDTARALAAGVPGLRAMQDGPADIREVATAFNQMLEHKVDMRLRLQASEARLRDAIAAAGLGFYDVDIASRQVTFDERTAAIWGLPPSRPVDADAFVACIHPDDRAAARAAVDCAHPVPQNRHFRAEYRVVSRVDGSIRNVVNAGRTVFEGDRPVHMVGFVEDITERRKLEADMRARRAEIEELTKRQVAAHTAAAIAHEINQPLAAVSAYSEAALALYRRGDTAPRKIIETLEGARLEARRAGHSLHELMAYLRDGEHVAQSFDVNAAVTDALDSLSVDFEPRVRMVLDLAPDLPPAWANRTQILKVLINLAQNGIDAMRAASVAAADMQLGIRTRRDGEFAEVSVTDRGPGLSAAAARRIFELFYSTKPSGMGLGLAISRALVEAQGGRLWCDLDAGTSGATFRFTVPLAD